MYCECRVRRCVQLDSVYFKERNLFDFFLKRCSFLPAIRAVPILSQDWRRKGTLIKKSYLHIKFRNLVHVETLLLGCCMNTIFHISKVAFTILWIKIDYLYEVFLIFSQPAVYSKSSPSRIKYNEKPLLRKSSWSAIQRYSKMIPATYNIMKKTF